MTRLMTPHETLRAARTALNEGHIDAVFGLADTLADEPDAEIQSRLAALLREAGEADPEALSVFLAANAFRLPRATVVEAGKALPEAG
mgnify:CR=1 FL=1